mmetsp:Transcript_87881/g.179260  ORF Transcript_87881/g.179260 Transcript_87881/m.179260 type:complete len:82 (+) Transcript_87881:83-328(+)
MVMWNILNILNVPVLSSSFLLLEIVLLLLECMKISSPKHKKDEEMLIFACIQPCCVLRKLFPLPVNSMHAIYLFHQDNHQG